MPKLILLLTLLTIGQTLYCQIDVSQTSGTGLRTSSGSGRGIWASSGTSYGTYSSSVSSYGIYGASNSSYGIFGLSNNSYAVYGQSTNGHGAYFRGANGKASIVLGGSDFIHGNDDGVILSDPLKSSSDIILVSNDAVSIELDDDNNENGAFEIKNGVNTVVFSVNELGTVRVKGTIVHGSDRNRKENIEYVNENDILNKISKLPISQWNYKDDTVKHIGPMAQDFHTAFEIGVDAKTIALVDADGVALAAIKALSRQNQNQREEIRIILGQLVELEERIEKLSRQ